jgi:hypothetical protein
MESNLKQPQTPTNMLEPLRVLSGVSPAHHDGDPCCPHCQTTLTLEKIINLMHSSGCEQYVWVKAQDGTTALIEVGLVNPRAVEILPRG